MSGIWQWIITGFAAGIGFGIAQWLLSKILK